MQLWSSAFRLGYKSISYSCTFAYVPSVDHLLSSPSKSGTSPFVSLILTSLLTASRVTALKLSIFSSSTLGRITLGAKAWRTRCHSSLFLEILSEPSVNCKS